MSVPDKSTNQTSEKRAAISNIEHLFDSKSAYELPKKKRQSFTVAVFHFFRWYGVAGGSAAFSCQLLM